MINEDAARRLVSLPDAIDSIERVFAALDRGQAKVFPVATGHGGNPGDRFAVKSGLLAEHGVVGCKIGTYWPGNRTRGLAAHASTVVVLDDATGYPRAVVAASYLTSVRTAAADAVAIRHLARPDSRTLGVVGAGHQALFDVRAACLVRPFERILVWSRTAASAEAFVATLVDEGLPAARAPRRTVVAEADVLLTVTPAAQILVDRDDVRPGTHISAMGADQPGKQELDPRILQDAICVADVVEQSVTIGELRAAFELGLIARDAIVPLGAVITGRLPGRRSAADLTVFDSSGMALQDLAMAELALARAGDDVSRVAW